VLSLLSNPVGRHPAQVCERNIRHVSFFRLPGRTPCTPVLSSSHPRKGPVPLLHGLGIAIRVPSPVTGRTLGVHTLPQLGQMAADHLMSNVVTPLAPFPGSCPHALPRPAHKRRRISPCDWFSDLLQTAADLGISLSVACVQPPFLRMHLSVVVLSYSSLRPRLITCRDRPVARAMDEIAPHPNVRALRATPNRRVRSCSVGATHSSRCVIAASVSAFLIPRRADSGSSEYENPLHMVLLENKA